jgi:hypothetical protein
MTTPSTIRVVIPLKVKRRNGRPRIVPPAELDAADEPISDPRTLRAIARAWDWRRRLERGEAATLSDIAQVEQVTLPFVSRYIRLAYLCHRTGAVVRTAAHGVRRLSMQMILA